MLFFLNVCHASSNKKDFKKAWADLTTGWLQSGLIGADQGKGPTEFLAGRNYIGHHHIVYLEVDFSVTPCDFEVQYVVDFYQVPTTYSGHHVVGNLEFWGKVPTEVEGL